MSRPAEVFGFLKEHPSVFYCDKCIAKALKLPNPVAVEQVTATLALCSGFTRTHAPCHDCQRNKLAIRAG